MSAIDRPKVLIVDDQARNLDALEAMLSPTDCVVLRANSADEALLCLLRNDFAAIVLDIRMPDMSGIELAKLIKRRKRSEHDPHRTSNVTLPERSSFGIRQLATCSRMQSTFSSARAGIGTAPEEITRPPGPMYAVTRKRSRRRI